MDPTPRRSSDSSDRSDSVKSEDLERWAAKSPLDENDDFDDDDEEKRDQDHNNNDNGNDLTPSGHNVNENGTTPTWLRSRSAGAAPDEDEGDYLSRRAEMILANAKKKLTV